MTGKALDAWIHSMTFADAAKVAIAAVEVGGTLIRSGDHGERTGELKTPREILTAYIAATRDIQLP